MTRPKVHNYFDNGGRVLAPECKEPGADQSFARECDINTIMARYQKTGLLNHRARGTPFWDDVSKVPTDLLHAQEILDTSKNAFFQLPSTLRAMFNNSPGELLMWLDDPANRDEAVKWGLISGPPTPQEEKKEEAK